jgi:hypothetical protein
VEGRKEVTMTDSSFREIAKRITPLFTTAGFITISELIDPVSDNGVVELKNGPVVLRFVRDRKQWFVEMRSTTYDEWFDSRYVLTLVDDTRWWVPAVDEATLRTFVEHILDFAPRWMPLFHPDVYAQTKRELNAKELKSARENFNYTPKA